MSQIMSQVGSQVGSQVTSQVGSRFLSPVAVRVMARVSRLAAVGAAVLLAAHTSPSTAYAAYAQEPPPRSDRLTVTVHGAGDAADGTYKVRCRPSGGSHPDPAGACAAVERSTRWGRDAFAPAPRDAVCTMQYGGPATARVTGTWAGRPVDAAFDRGDGCAIARWDRLVPLLPEASAGRRVGAQGA